MVEHSTAMNDILRAVSETSSSPAADDRRRFDEWYKAERPTVLRAVRWLAVDDHTAEDATAEAFARAWVHWHRLGPYPTAWTLRVATNVVRRRVRLTRLHTRVAAEAASREQTASLRETDIDLWRAVAQLSRRQREVVVFRYIGNLTEPEIAEVLRIRVGTVSATLSQARSELRRILKGHNDG